MINECVTNEYMQALADDPGHNLAGSLIEFWISILHEHDFTVLRSS